MSIKIEHKGLKNILVDSTDSVSSPYLASKIVAGSNVVLTVLNPGANEQLQINASGASQFAQLVYLDKNASALTAVGLSAFSTFQAAYNAANTAQIALGGSNSIVIVVGVGLSSDFGNLVLTAAYNPRVILVGWGAAASQLGTVTGNFDFVCSAFELTMGNITAHSNIITLSGADSIFGNIDSSKTGGVGGFVTLGAGLTCGTINSTGDTGGEVDVGVGCTTGTVTTDGQNLGGNIVVSSNSHVGKLFARGLAGGSTGGFVDVDHDVQITGFTPTVNASGGATGGRVLLGQRCLVNGIVSTGTTAVGGQVDLSLYTSNTSVITTTGGTLPGQLSLANYCSSGTIVANGGTGTAAITIGDYCTLTSVTSTATTGNGGAINIGNFVTFTGILSHAATAGVAGTIGIGNDVKLPSGIVNSGGSEGGNVTLGNNCSVGNALTTAATVSGAGGSIVTGNQCVLSSVSSTGITTGGGNITLGHYCSFDAVDAQSTSNGSGGTIVIGSYGRGSSTLNCTGISGGASVTFGKFTSILGSLSAGGGTGNSQALLFDEGCAILSIFASSTGTGGSITFGNHCVCGSITHLSTGDVSGAITFGASCVFGTINSAGTTGSGSITIGDSCTCTGSVIRNPGNGGATGGISCGVGCILPDLLNFGGNQVTNGAITIGAACTVGNIAGGGSRNGANIGDITIGSGSIIGNIDGSAGGAAGAGKAANITLFAGALCGTIDASVGAAGATAGTVTLQRASKTSTITFGTNSSANLQAVRAQITGKIDRLSANSLLHECVLSTDSGNLDCIGEVDGAGVQLIGCLAVPNGTGKPITSSAPRTVRAYNNVFKTTEGVNITLAGANNFVDSTITAPA